MDDGMTGNVPVLLLTHILTQVSYKSNEVIKVGLLYSHNSKLSMVRLSPMLAKKQKFDWENILTISITKIQIVAPYQFPGFLLYVVKFSRILAK